MENHLDVDGNHTAYVGNRYLDDYDIRDYDWYQHKPGYTTTPDTKIKEEIEQELWWSPFVNAQEVSVKVERKADG